MFKQIKGWFIYSFLGLIILTMHNYTDAQLTDEGVNVILLIDISQSMKESDPNGYRLRIAKLFVGLAKSKQDRIGIVTFGNKGKILYDIEILTDEEKNKIIEKIGQIKSEDDYTNLSDGLKVAYERIKKLSEREQNNCILVLLTDGQIKLPDIEEIKQKCGREALENWINKFKEQNLPIYTIGLGADCDESLLKYGIAEKTNALFLHTKDYKDESLIYSKIIRDKFPQISSYEITKESDKIITSSKEVIITGNSKLINNLKIYDQEGNICKSITITRYGVARIFNPDGIKLVVKPPKSKVSPSLFIPIISLLLMIILIMRYIFLFYQRSLIGFLKITTTESTIERLKGRQIFLNPSGSDKLILRHKQDKKSIAKLYKEKQDVKLESIISDKYPIWVKEGTFTKKIRVREGIDYHLKDSCTLTYFKDNPNPYNPRTPVCDKEMFVGRKKEIDEIVRNFKGSTPQIVFLYGPRRSGKTSLIYQIEDRLKDSHIPVRIDFILTSLQRYPLRNLLHTLFRETCAQFSVDETQKLGISTQVSDELTIPSLIKDRFLLEFEKIKSLLETKQKRLIISLDESQDFVNKVSTNELKEIINSFEYFNNKLKPFYCFLFAGVEPLATQSVKDEKFEIWNNFRDNSCKSFHIGLLESEEVENLIREPIEKNCLTLKIKDKIEEDVINKIGKHPYFIQLFCHTLIDYCNNQKRNKPNKKDIDQCLQIMLDKAYDTFWLLWNELKEDEKLILATASDILKEETHPDISINSLKKELKKKGLSDERLSQINFDTILKNLSQHLILNTQPKDKTDIFYVPLWGIWIRENITLDMIIGEF